MATSVQQIDLWLAAFENQRLEFKEAKRQYDFEKLKKYCVALANEGGGHFILGVSDGPPRKVVGTGAFANATATEEQLLRDLGFRVDLEEIEYRGHRLLAFHIPTRPRGMAYHIEGRYLMRSGSALVPMSPDYLRRIFDEGAPDWLQEPSKSGLDDQELVALLDTQAFFDLLGAPYPTSRAGVIEKLSMSRLIDPGAGGYSVRRLGALLLAKRLADFPDLERKAPRVVVYDGTSKLRTKGDTLGTKGYAVGFQGLVAFVAAQLPQNEIVEDALRRAAKLVPDDVIRELVANALIHQDFSLTGTSVMVEIYNDRVEISNPGEPVVPVERFIDGYRSRNEQLADLMRRMRICEERSSGIDRVVQAAEFYQLPAPDFRSDLQRTRVIVYGPREFEAMDKGDRVRACYQHCVLKWVMSQRMTNQSLRERFRLPERRSATISQVIAATIEARMIKPDEAVGSSKKYARYLPEWA